MAVKVTLADPLLRSKYFSNVVKREIEFRQTTYLALLDVLSRRLDFNFVQRSGNGIVIYDKGRLVENPHETIERDSRIEYYFSHE